MKLAGPQKVFLRSSENQAPPPPHLFNPVHHPLYMFIELLLLTWNKGKALQENAYCADSSTFILHRNESDLSSLENNTPVNKLNFTHTKSFSQRWLPNILAGERSTSYNARYMYLLD